LNFELEREILGFGDRVKVLEPPRLKRRIKEILEHAVDSYQYEFNSSALQNNLQKFLYKGFALLHHVYRKKEVDLLKNKIHQYFKETGATDNAYSIRNLLAEIPSLQPLVFTSNLLQVLKKISPDLFLTKALYFDKSPDANWYVTWHQDISISVSKRIETEGFTGWTTKNEMHGVCPPEEILHDTVTIRIHLDDTEEANGALKIIPGSHKKKLSDDEIKLITQNSVPYVCDVPTGGIHIMKPLLLHASSKATKQGHRRVIHLEFNTVALPNGLEWAEKLLIF
jgi:hypothetical protein